MLALQLGGKLWAETVGVSLSDDDVLERKALAGLVAACQAQPKGPPVRVRSSNWRDSHTYWGGLGVSR